MDHQSWSWIINHGQLPTYLPTYYLLPTTYCADQTSVVCADKTSVASADTTSGVSADKNPVVCQDIPMVLRTQGAAFSGPPVLAMKLGCLCRQQISYLQTQQISCLQTQQMSCLHTHTPDVLSAQPRVYIYICIYIYVFIVAAHS